MQTSPRHVRFTPNSGHSSARVAREKKLEGWTLLLSRNAVEALLRERAQFLPEKKKDDKKGGR